MRDKAGSDEAIVGRSVANVWSGARWTAGRCLLIATAGLLMGLSACGDDDDADTTTPDSSQELTGQGAIVGTFGGRFDKDLQSSIFDPVSEETGLTISIDVPTDYAKIKAAVEAESPPPYDVAMAGTEWSPAHCGTLLETVDVDRSQIDPKYVTDDCSMPADVYSYNIAYNEETYADDPPTSWSDFFDTEKFPGTRAVWGAYSVQGLIEGALLADGVAPDDLYPLDLDRAFAKLDTIKSELTFYDTLAQSEEMMTAGDVDMLVAVNLNGFTAGQNGAPYVPIWNGAMVNWNTYTVPKGANVAAAGAILERIGSEAGQTDMASVQPVGPTVEGLDPPLDDPLLAEWNPSNPENEGDQVILDAAYYRENYDLVDQRFFDWVAG